MKYYCQTSECFRHPHRPYSSLPDKPWKKATLSLHLGHFAENFLEKILLFDKVSLLNLLSAFCWNIYFNLPVTIPAYNSSSMFLRHIQINTENFQWLNKWNPGKNIQYPGWISIIKWRSEQGAFLIFFYFIKWKGTHSVAQPCDKINFLQRESTQGSFWFQASWKTSWIFFQTLQNPPVFLILRAPLLSHKQNKSRGERECAEEWYWIGLEQCCIQLFY